MNKRKNEGKTVSGVRGKRTSDEGVSSRLLLRSGEAAAALALSPRLLWTLTERGEVHCIRIGRAVRYDPRDLTAWIDRQKTVGSQRSRGGESPQAS